MTTLIEVLKLLYPGDTIDLYILKAAGEIHHTGTVKEIREMVSNSEYWSKPVHLISTDLLTGRLYICC